MNNHLEITPTLRDKKRVELTRKAQTPFITFWVMTALPFLVYFLYSIGVFQIVWKDTIQELEEATSLVSTDFGVGTAFLISENKLLTARHVVEDVPIGNPVNLIFEKMNPQISTTAVLEWRDETVYADGITLDYFLTDVAILRLIDPQTVEKIKPLSLGSSDDIPNLTPIIAIGYPGGDYSITEGNINSDNVDEKELFKLDAASNPGNSGGPIISKDDYTVIGMLVGKKGGVIEGENIANKINNILQLLDSNGINLE